MKYRKLTKQELESLRDEFVKFLIVQGIDAPQWEEILLTYPKKADGFIELFSDFIFETIVQKVKYLEKHESDNIKLYKCDENIIRLLGIECDQSFNTTEDFFQEMKTSAESFRTFRAAKAYSPDRESEIFRMIQTGSVITKGELYESFMLAQELQP
ncbi:MAG: hypothetical protein IPL08_20180 [Saprospiraceae bacterium]|nr:hypothetical protein [Saprospiraceae bacterium]MBK8669092.1 hypothetical protein [Saprospiraceae bacterium]